MRLPWPWRRAPAADRVVIASQPDRLVYAWSDALGHLKRCGVEERGRDTPADFQRRLKALGLPVHGVCAVLPLADSQLIQIEAPAVKPEELKAAARWRIKDQVEGRLDELTIDVMVVGDDKPRPNRQLFVAAARNDAIRATAERSRALGLELTIVDIAETAQRNLQTELATAAGLGSRASAALVRHGAHALLTICAAGELYYARRIDWEAPPMQNAPKVEAQRVVAELAFEGADIVDYGAEADGAAAANDDDAPRIVIELQRSFDLWERSWPDLPLAALWVQVGDDSEALANLLAGTLSQKVGVLDPAEALPGFGRAAATPAVRAAVLPIVGALLRHETRRL
jgi:MSHA biogenesis protein MshI